MSAEHVVSDVVTAVMDVAPKLKKRRTTMTTDTVATDERCAQKDQHAQEHRPHTVYVNVAAMANSPDRDVQIETLIQEAWVATGASRLVLQLKTFGQNAALRSLKVANAKDRLLGIIAKAREVITRLGGPDTSSVKHIDYIFLTGVPSLFYEVVNKWALTHWQLSIPLHIAREDDPAMPTDLAPPACASSASASASASAPAPARASIADRGEATKSPRALIATTESPPTARESIDVSFVCDGGFAMRPYLVVSEISLGPNGVHNSTSEVHDGAVGANIGISGNSHLVVLTLRRTVHVGAALLQGEDFETRQRLYVTLGEDGLIAESEEVASAVVRVSDIRKNRQTAVPLFCADNANTPGSALFKLLGSYHCEGSTVAIVTFVFNGSTHDREGGARMHFGGLHQLVSVLFGHDAGRNEEANRGAAKFWLPAHKTVVRRLCRDAALQTVPWIHDSRNAGTIQLHTCAVNMPGPALTEAAGATEVPYLPQESLKIPTSCLANLIVNVALEESSLIAIVYGVWLVCNSSTSAFVWTAESAAFALTFTCRSMKYRSNRAWARKKLKAADMLDFHVGGFAGDCEKQTFETARIFRDVTNFYARHDGAPSCELSVGEQCVVSLGRFLSAFTLTLAVVSIWDHDVAAVADTGGGGGGCMGPTEASQAGLEEHSGSMHIFPMLIDSDACRCGEVFDEKGGRCINLDAIAPIAQGSILEELPCKFRQARADVDVKFCLQLPCNGLVHALYLPFGHPVGRRDGPITIRESLGRYIPQVLLDSGGSAKTTRRLMVSDIASTYLPRGTLLEHIQVAPAASPAIAQLEREAFEQIAVALTPSTLRVVEQVESGTGAAIVKSKLPRCLYLSSHNGDTDVPPWKSKRTFAAKLKECGGASAARWAVFGRIEV